MSELLLTESVPGPAPQRGLTTSVELTHKVLVGAAAQWLQRQHSIVITEMATTGEEPDAIGWTGVLSTLVECKASLADFRADGKKFFRRSPEMGMGTFRYFLTPVGMVRPELLPRNWGLLELVNGKVQVTVAARQFGDANRRHEITMLVSALRRVGRSAPSGVSIKCYTIDTKSRATLGVSTEEDGV